MIDPFSDPDITILTTDREAREAIWDLQDTFQVSEKLERSFTPERVHEIWLVANDALQSGALVAAIYKIFKPSKGKTSIRIGTRFNLTKDDAQKMKEIGCEVTFEKEGDQP